MDEDRSALDVIRGSRTLAYTLGAVALVAGVVLVFWPGRTVTVVARLTGVLLLVVGVGDLFDVLRNHRRGSYWPLLALRGVLDVAIGAALVFWPGVTVGVVTWLVGLDFVIGGVLGLLVRGRMPAELRGSILSRALVTIAFGAAIMVWPGATVKVVAFLTGALLILFGLVFVWSGRQIRSLERDLA